MRSMFGLAAVVVCAACNTPEQRIEDNQALYDTYSPADRTTIKSGQIRQGFVQNQVYMALGKPSRKKVAGTKERWMWLEPEFRVITIKKDIDQYTLERNEYEQGRRAQPPSTEETIVQSRTRIARVVKFKNGRVVSWEDPLAMFADDWH